MTSTRFVSVLAVLLFATAATAATVEIRFSGTTTEISSRAFSGWLRYEKPLPVVEFVTSGTSIVHADYIADAPDDLSFISWAITIGTDSYAPVVDAFNRDLIRVYDGTYGGGDFLEYFSGHAGGTVLEDKSLFFLMFGDTGGTQLSGWGVPEPLPTSGWTSAFMEMSTWESGSKVTITGQINDVTVVPLPTAAWPALALLGGLLLRRRYRRVRRA
jgi:hypothetical protein